jgi:hypothetical protein
MDLERCANRVPQAIHHELRRKATTDAAKSTGAWVIDPEPWLCTSGGNCPVAVENTLVYRDASHMAETYSEAIAPVLGQRLSALFGADLQG